METAKEARVVNVTPVPNILFDVYLSEFKKSHLKIFLVVVRQTLGWKDEKTKLKRKMHDWISNSQLRKKTKISKRGITRATDDLVKKNLIEVLDCDGNLLDTSELRKGKKRLYYRLSTYVLAGITPVDKEGTTSEQG